MKKKNKNKKLIFMIVILLVLIIFLIYYYATKDDIFKKYKKDKSNNIVYTIYSDKNINVPNINLKGVGVEEINKNIVDKANEFLKGKNTITYTFEINGKILSLAIQYVDYYEDKYYPTISYDVYNVNFYDSKVLSNKDMLDLYEISESDVKPIIESKFYEYFKELKEKNYYHNECDYGCFLFQRGIENDKYMNNIYYYIKNGNLYAIRPFKIYSSFKEENYFSTKHFLIQITQ